MKLNKSNSQLAATQQLRRSRNNHTSLKDVLVKGAVLAFGASLVRNAAAAPVLLNRNADYTVAAGDTLSKIAGLEGVSLSALEAANPQITNVDLIQPGQVIHVPGAGFSAGGATPTTGLTAPEAASQLAQLQSDIASLQGGIATATSPSQVQEMQQAQSNDMNEEVQVEAALQNGGSAPTLNTNAPAPQPTVAPAPSSSQVSTSAPAPTNAPAPIVPAPTSSAAPAPTNAPAPIVPAPSSSSSQSAEPSSSSSQSAEPSSSSSQSAEPSSSSSQNAAPTDTPAPGNSGGLGDNVVSGSLSVGTPPAGVTVTGTGLWLDAATDLGPVKNLAVVEGVNMATHVDALPSTPPNNVGDDEWANAIKFLPAANAAAAKWNLPVLLLLSQTIQETSLGTNAPCTENSIGNDGKMHYDCGPNQVDDQWFPAGTSFADITNIFNNFDHGAMVLSHYINTNGGTVQGGLSKYATDPTYYTKVVGYWKGMSSGS